MDHADKKRKTRAESPPADEAEARYADIDARRAALDREERVYAEQERRRTAAVRDVSFKTACELALAAVDSGGGGGESPAVQHACAWRPTRVGRVAAGEAREARAHLDPRRHTYDCMSSDGAAGDDYADVCFYRRAPCAEIMCLQTYVYETLCGTISCTLCDMCLESASRRASAMRESVRAATSRDTGVPFTCEIDLHDYNASVRGELQNEHDKIERLRYERANVVKVAERLGATEHVFANPRRGGADNFPSEKAAREFGAWLDAHHFQHGTVARECVDYWY